MFLEQEDTQAAAFEQRADCAPLGPDDVHLRLQLERSLVERWAVGRLDGRQLGLHHANPIECNLIPVHHIHPGIRVVLDHQAIAICRPVEAAGQLDERVEVGLGVVEVEILQANAQGCLLQDGGLQEIAPVGRLGVF